MKMFPDLKLLGITILMLMTASVDLTAVFRSVAAKIAACLHHAS
jgi:hypothetical protein